jgi:hypothetical protein
MEVVPIPQVKMVPIRPGAKNFMIRALHLDPERDLVNDETNPGGGLMLNESNTQMQLLSPHIAVLFNLILRPENCPLLQYRIDTQCSFPRNLPGNHERSLGD